MTRKLLLIALFVLQATFFFGAGMWFEFDRRVNARERQIHPAVHRMDE